MSCCHNYFLNMTTRSATCIKCDTVQIDGNTLKHTLLPYGGNSHSGTPAKVGPGIVKTCNDWAIRSQTLMYLISNTMGRVQRLNVGGGFTSVDPIRYSLAGCESISREV